MAGFNKARLFFFFCGGGGGGAEAGGRVLDYVSIISMQKRNAKVIPKPCYLDFRKTGLFTLLLF